MITTLQKGTEGYYYAVVETVDTTRYINTIFAGATLSPKGAIPSEGRCGYS